MHVGTCIPFMNHARVDDHEVMKGELALGDLAEPLGFDSLWCFEHHFSSYMLSPNPLQILTYFAGRTRRIQLGTMVVVLPWHHPVRVAEEVLLLDHFSHGRTRLHSTLDYQSPMEYENAQNLTSTTCLQR